MIKAIAPLIKQVNVGVSRELLTSLCQFTGQMREVTEDMKSGRQPYSRCRSQKKNRPIEIKTPPAMKRNRETMKPPRKMISVIMPTDM